MTVRNMDPMPLPDLPVYVDFRQDPCWSGLFESPELWALESAWKNYVVCLHDFASLSDRYERDSQTLPDEAHAGHTGQTPLDTLRYDIEWAYQRGMSSFEQLQLKFDEWVQAAPAAAHALHAIKALTATAQPIRAADGPDTPTLVATQTNSRTGVQRRSDPPQGDAKKPRGARLRLSLRQT